MQIKLFDVVAASPLHMLSSYLESNCGLGLSSQPIHMFHLLLCYYI